MSQFTNIIKINTDYITLGQFLKFSGIIDNGSYAKIYLSENKVLVNDELEDRRGRKLYPNYTVVVENKLYKIESE